MVFEEGLQIGRNKDKQRCISREIKINKKDQRKDVVNRQQKERLKLL